MMCVLPANEKQGTREQNFYFTSEAVGLTAR